MPSRVKVINSDHGVSHQYMHITIIWVESSTNELSTGQSCRVSPFHHDSRARSGNPMHSWFVTDDQVEIGQRQKVSGAKLDAGPII